MFLPKKHKNYHKKTFFCHTIKLDLSHSKNKIKLFRSVIDVKNMKRALLAAAIIASLSLSTAFAATTDYTNCTGAGCPRAAANQAGLTEESKTEQTKVYPGMRQRKGPNIHMKILAQVTGKDEATLREECRKDKLTPAQYADKQGKYAEYKAKRLEYAQGRMNTAVKEGRLTQAKADSYMQKVAQRIEEEKAGKMMRPMRMHHAIVGPEHDVARPCNPDGSVCQGYEGMSYRESPFYGKMPFDTLSKLTDKTPQALYAEAYKEKLSAAGLAKKLGVFEEYKAKRLKAHKQVLARGVKDGKFTQEQADKMLKRAENRIDKCKGEMARPEPRHRGHGPMHPGPQVPPEEMQQAE